MPLWGEVEPEPEPLPKEIKLVVRRYKAQITCHLCAVDAARGTTRHERDLAAYEIVVGDYRWLACRAHIAEVRSSPRLLSKYPQERNDR